MRTTLFKLDARGQVREWTIWIENHPTRSMVFIRHGANGQQQIIDSNCFTEYNHEYSSNFII